MGHVCKFAVRPDVAASISSNITFAACFGHRCIPSQFAPVSTRQVSLHSGLLPPVVGYMRHVCKFAIRPDVAFSISSNITFAACFDHLCNRCVPSQVASVSTRQVSLLSGLLPPVVGYMGHVCKLAVRPDVAFSISSNITFAACFDHPCNRCVPSQVAPVSTRQVSLLSGLLPSVFGCTGHVCKLAVLPDVAASISSNITFAACFGHRCVPSHVDPVPTRQVALHFGLLPSVFGCTRHVCKLAVRPDVAASISSNFTFGGVFDHRCIGLSKVKSLPFQHRKSVFIPDCCHQCSDARGTSASSPFVRTLPFRSAATSLLRRV